MVDRLELFGLWAGALGAGGETGQPLGLINDGRAEPLTLQVEKVGKRRDEGWWMRSGRSKVGSEVLVAWISE